VREWRRLRLGLLLLAAIPACGPSRPRTVVREFPGMGTLGSVTALSDEEAFAWAAQCAQITREWEGRLSLFQADSELARINGAAGREAVPVSFETIRPIVAALRLAEESGGAFDPTVGPLMRLWGFRGDGVIRKPAAEEIAAIRERVGYGLVRVSGQMVLLEREGMQLDLGGIGKGFAVDRCWEAIRRTAGGRPFLVNLGGNMRASGRPSSNRPWRIGIRHPFQPDALLGTLRLDDGMAVATSGHYEQFVEVAGERWSHIMDPRRGEPVRGMASVTVVADTAEEADGLSTTLFVLGPEEGEAFLRRTGRTAAVLYVPDRQPLQLIPNPAMAVLLQKTD